MSESIRRESLPGYYLCECGAKYENAQDAAMCGSNFTLIINDKKEDK